MTAENLTLPIAETAPRLAGRARPGHGPLTWVQNPTATVSARTAWMHLLLAVIAFGFVSARVRRLVPWPERYGLRDKYEYFAQHKDEYDALFVGPSTVFRSFVPPVIDAELRRHGVAMRSFNFGVAGMTALEADHVLRDLLALKPKRLRWVFVEQRSWSPHLWDEDNVFTQRSVHWHSLESTLIALRCVWLADDTWADKLDLAVTHVQLFAWNLAGFGQGRRIAAALLGVGEDDPIVTERSLDAEHGYQALEDLTGKRVALRRRTHLAEPKAFRTSVARLDRRNTEPRDLDHFNARDWRAQLDAIRAAGAEPVPIVAPSTLAQPLVYALRDAGYLPGLMAFNSPQRYPRLYRKEMWFDQSHLTRQGAVEFSRIFAEAFASRVESP